MIEKFWKLKMRNKKWVLLSKGYRLALFTEVGEVI
jgi:hypothetical protein